MLKIILEPSDISQENTLWNIKKLKNVPKSTELLTVEIAGCVINLIACGDGKFVPWRTPKGDHDSLDSQ